MKNNEVAYMCEMSANTGMTPGLIILYSYELI